MKTKKKIALGSLWICCLLVLSLMAGCKTQTITVPTTLMQTTVKTVTTTAAAATTATKTTTTVPPKLSSVSVTLAVTATSDYAGYPLPLYISRDMVLHLSWKVEGGPFRMTVTTPGGKVLPITLEGVQTSGTAEPLDDSGGIVFCPSDTAYSGLGLGDGYFNFTPNLTKGDAPVKITLNYYFDTLPDTASTVSTTPVTSATATTHATSITPTTSTHPVTS